MKLMILLAVVTALSAICSVIFTNPNKHSKACEAPADQPFIGIFGVCLFLISVGMVKAVFEYMFEYGFLALALWLLSWFIARYLIKGQERAYLQKRS